MKVISFEGIDACGKATMSEKLRQFLIKKVMLRTKLVDFPQYETGIGKQIKGFLTEVDDISPENAHLLYELDRFAFCNNPENYSDLDILIFDRYSLSNIAFMHAKGIDTTQVNLIRNFMAVKPDITFLLDISVETSFARRPDRGDKHERDTRLLEDVRNAYRTICIKEASGLYEIIECDGKSEEKVFQEILASLIHHGII